MAPRLSSYSTQKRNISAGTSISGKKLEAQKRPRQSFGISFPPSIETKENHSFRHGQATLPTEKLTNQEDTNELKISQLVCIFTIPVLVSPITALSTLLQPFLDGRSVQKRPHIRKTPEKLRSLLTKGPTKNDTSKPPYTGLPRVRILAGVDCTHDAQRNTT